MTTLQEIEQYLPEMTEEELCLLLDIIKLRKELKEMPASLDRLKAKKVVLVPESLINKSYD
jgi:hypothetical protein